MPRKSNVEVSVIDGNIEGALRKLRKRSEREGVNRDMKRCVYYEPESQKRRKRNVRAAKKNWMRMAARGLI